jgi:hypothetical protein
LLEAGAKKKVTKKKRRQEISLVATSDKSCAVLTAQAFKKA